MTLNCRGPVSSLPLAAPLPYHALFHRPLFTSVSSPHHLFPLGQVPDSDPSITVTIQHQFHRSPTQAANNTTSPQPRWALGLPREDKKPTKMPVLAPPPGT
eukprot:2300371-Amphidinium_carterae.2